MKSWGCALANKIPHMGQNEKSNLGRPEMVHPLQKWQWKHYTPFCILSLYQTNLECLSNSSKHKSSLARPKSRRHLEFMVKFKKLRFPESPAPFTHLGYLDGKKLSHLPGQIIHSRYHCNIRDLYYVVFSSSQRYSDNSCHYWGTNKLYTTMGFFDGASHDLICGGGGEQPFSYLSSITSKFKWD